MSNFRQKKIVLEIRATGWYWNIPEGQTVKVWSRYNHITGLYEKHREEAPAFISRNVMVWYNRGTQYHSQKQPPDLDW